MDKKVEFNRTWRQLAEQGKCDAYGGAEYTRVLEEWQLAGCPIPCAKFIVWRANAWAGECQPKIKQIVRQLLTLVSAMRAAADGSIMFLRRQAAELPADQQAAGQELVAQREATIDLEFIALRTEIEALTNAQSR